MSRDYWCFPTLHLDEVAAKLDTEFRFAAPAEFDAENLYEWFEATSTEGADFNVSREHVNGKSCFASPLRFMVTIFPSTVADFGARLASCLGCTVFYGDVEYLEGDHFRYVAAYRYEPIDRERVDEQNP